VHSREDELFYVLEGEFDMHVGEEALNANKGECIFLPTKFDRVAMHGTRRSVLEAQAAF